MLNRILLLLTLCALPYASRAAEKAVPTLRVLPTDVEQSSIQQLRLATNQFAVRWTYTEAGARKIIAFREAHEGQKTIMAIGSFQTPPMGSVFKPMPPAFTTYAQWKEGWLKRRTDKYFGSDEKDAKAIAAGLKGK